MTVATGQIDSRRIVRRLGAGRTPIVLQIVLFSLVVLYVLPECRRGCVLWLVGVVVFIGVLAALAVGHCFPSVTIILCPVGGADQCYS